MCSPTQLVDWIPKMLMTILLPVGIRESVKESQVVWRETGLNGDSKYILLQQIL